jgi:hypothetical protein
MTRRNAEPLRGLVIDRPYVDWILTGKKTWEIRGKATTRRGPIALIAKGTGTVVGTCNLIDVRGPLKLAELKANAKRQNRKPADITSPLYYGNHTYAWVLSGARRLRTPIAYQHPSGAVVWVKLNAHVTTRLMNASPKRSRRKLARSTAAKERKR